MNLYPDFQTFKQNAKKGNLIALTHQIPADLETPVSTFLKLAEKLPHAFLLESAEQGEQMGRYSIIGLKPKKILKNKSLSNLKDCLKNYKLANPEVLPGFSGGLVGFLGYENVKTFEDIKLTPKKNIGTPQSVFFLTEELIIFDHYRKTLTLAVLLDKNSGSLQNLYKFGTKKIKTIKLKLEKPLKIQKKRRAKLKHSIRSNMTPKQFQSKVKKIKNYIKAGDCIQVVLSQRFTITGPHNDFQVYRALRSINPSPYMFYFKSKDFRLIGSSPEVLVKKTGKNAEVRPIAGTRPRGRTKAQDGKYAESLKRSPKEMAEHLMLVDLGRNDLGRVCEYESIQVQNFARIENYSHVMHLVSDVAGKLKRSKDAFDLLEATFPAGTVSGAPKIRAMEIINELEPEERGPYAGCLGYFGFNHDMDMCITIRTLVAQKNKVYLQAGAGIVKDSNPTKEFEETQNKARALLKAIEKQGDFS